MMFGPGHACGARQRVRGGQVRQPGPRESQGQQRLRAYGDRIREDGVLGGGRRV